MEAINIDSQHLTHGESYAYSSSLFPDFYDLWVEQLFGSEPSEDIAIFQQVLEELISSSPTNQFITILDLGTGTGRVVLDLLSYVTSRHQSHQVRFVGIDHSSAMLERAERKLQKESNGKNVEKYEWYVATAANFVERAGEQLLKGKVDLLIFAAGGISHLVKDEEVVAFLAQVKLSLKADGKSRAIISVLHEFMSGPDTVKEASTDDAENSQTNVEVPSHDVTGPVYIKTPTISTWDGDIRTDKFSISMKADNGDPYKKTAQDVAWSVKLLDEKTWAEEIDKAGLEIESIEAGSIQKWYLLKLAEL